MQQACINLDRAFTNFSERRKPVFLLFAGRYVELRNSYWLAPRQPDFAASYACAKDEGMDAFADRLVSRAADVPPELANSRKLEVDSGKWYLSKIAHKRYGDRFDVRQEISGPNGDPITVDVLHSLLLRPERIGRTAWAQINLDEAMISIKGAKDGKSGDHPLHGDDVRALRRLCREHPHSPWVFVNDRGDPFSTDGCCAAASCW